MKILIGFVLAIGSLVWVTQGTSEDRNWPQWRGPDGTGKTSATDVPSVWGTDQNVK